MSRLTIPGFVFIVLLRATVGYAQHISTDALRPLDFMIGEWTVEVDARLSKNGPWEKSIGHSKISWVVGKTVIQDVFTGTKQGRELLALTFLANDNRTKLYQKVAADSDHGVLMKYEGNLEGKLLTMDTHVNINDVHLVLRTQYNLAAQNFFTVENFRSVDNGSTWDRTGSMKYTRSEP